MALPETDIESIKTFMDDHPHAHLIACGVGDNHKGPLHSWREPIPREELLNYLRQPKCRYIGVKLASIGLGAIDIDRGGKAVCNDIDGQLEHKYEVESRVIKSGRDDHWHIYIPIVGMISDYVWEHGEFKCGSGFILLHHLQQALGHIAELLDLLPNAQRLTEAQLHLLIPKETAGQGKTGRNITLNKEVYHAIKAGEVQAANKKVKNALKKGLPKLEVVRTAASATLAGKNKALGNLVAKTIAADVEPEVAVAYCHKVAADTYPDSDLQPLVDELFKTALAEDKTARPTARRHIKIYEANENSDEDELKNRLSALGYEIRWNSRSLKLEAINNNKKNPTWRSIGTSPTFEGLRSLLQKDLVTAPQITKGGIIGLKHDRITPQRLQNDLLAIGDSNKIDPFLVWLVELPRWDKTQRLPGLLSECFSVHSDYAQLAEFAIPSVMMAAVNRAITPGSKYDLVPVLVGEEGLGKSTFWRELAVRREFFFDGFRLDAKAQEHLEQTTGHVFIELAELTGIKRADRRALDAMITSTTDKARLAYGRARSDVPRTFVFVGTTNEQHHLPIGAGDKGRRWLPIVVTRKNVDRSCAESMQDMQKYVCDNLEQLWAEAYSAVLKGKEFHLPPDLERTQAKTVDEHKIRNHLVEDKVDSFLDNNGCNSFQLATLMSHLNLPNPMPVQSYVTDYLRNKGWESGMEGASRRRKWIYRR